MKKTQKLLIALALAASCSMYSASAQIYVHIRPIVPVVIRTEPPSQHHIWVNEEWQEVDGQYVFIGGHWAEPPREGYRYTEGHWDHSGRGHRWHNGGWNERREHGHEGHEGHEHGHEGRR